MTLIKRNLGTKILDKFFNSNKHAQLAILRENTKCNDIIIDSLMNPNINDRYYTEEDLIWANIKKTEFRELSEQIESYLEENGN